MGIEENNIDKREKKFPTDLQTLWDLWFANNTDMLNGAPAELPPLREINHQIPLIDENLKYHYWLPCCPEAMKPQLMAKLCKYMDAGWWRPRTMLQAAPLLCIPKRQRSSERS
jgi:hypothetical protein